MYNSNTVVLSAALPNAKQGVMAANMHWYIINTLAGIVGAKICGLFPTFFKTTFAL